MPCVNEITPRPPCPWCGSSVSRVVLSRPELDEPIFRRRRRCGRVPPLLADDGEPGHEEVRARG